MEQPTRTYLAVWEFQARPGMERQFEEAYGPAGAWVRFFRSAEGYRGSELTRDANCAGRYLTLDFWSSRAQYEKFCSAHAQEYAAIDRACADMTESETPLGTFEEANIPRSSFAQYVPQQPGFREQPLPQKELAGAYPPALPHCFPSSRV